MSFFGRIRAIWARAADAGKPLTLVVFNTPESGVDDETFKRVVMGCAVQLHRDVAPEYGDAPPTVTAVPASCGVTGPARDGVSVAWLAVVGSIPDAPGDQGYHEPLGSADAYDGYISTQGLDTDGLSECLSHELVETLGDPTCAITVTSPDGSTYPRELCDAAQAETNAQRVPISLDDGGPPVMCSNWILPSYWRSTPDDGTPVDFLSRAQGKTGSDRYVPGPFGIGTYGYSAITKNGQETDVYGPSGPAMLPPSKQHADARIQVCLSAMREATR